MKKILFFLMILAGCTGRAQDSFDIIQYTAPKGWKKEATQQAVQFSKQDDAKGTYCIITVMKSLTASANAKENFDAAWVTVVKEMVKVSAEPEMQPAAEEDGWKALSGYAPYESEGTKGIALLVTSTGFQKMVNILVLTNTDAYEPDMSAFLGSVSFKKQDPVANKQLNKPSDPSPPSTLGYAFSRTNFDDGWVSTIHNDYVLVAKNNVKVYLSYIEKFNESDYSGTGLQKRHHYWDNYVSKYFTTGEKKFDQGGSLSDYSQDFIEGWATDKQTGEKRYLGMIINVIAYTGRLSVIIASAPDEQQFRRQFPKADSRYHNDLQPMYSYNKFAIGKNELAGKWSSSGGGTMGWYSTTTGQNVGATGVVKGDEFQFNTNSSYSSKHNGATGWVGSMNTYQQNYKGNYTVTDWTITITNRWDGKTEKYNAWFEVLKGGRVLHMDSQSLNYSLFKER